MTKVCNCALPAITGSNECCKNCTSGITGISNIYTDISNYTITYANSFEEKLGELLNELNEFIDNEYPDETDYFGQGITETAILEAKEEWLGQLINIVESYR